MDVTAGDAAASAGAATEGVVRMNSCFPSRGRCRPSRRRQYTAAERRAATVPGRLTWAYPHAVHAVAAFGLGWIERITHVEEQRPMKIQSLGHAVLKVRNME